MMTRFALRTAKRVVLAMQEAVGFTLISTLSRDKILDSAPQAKEYFLREEKIETAQGILPDGANPTSKLMKIVRA